MAEWYVKELSDLTQVSVQTLHHYDRIGLLKPSVRLPNGYRLYSEKDLLKLQQIIALKYFGFQLSQIKTLLAADVNMLDHFSVQSQFLEEKANSLLHASEALKKIITDCRRDKSIPWKTIIKLIEVYRMTQELEKTWAGKVLSPEELKEYASFAQGLKTRFTPAEKKAFEDKWQNLVREVYANIDNDPGSATGIDIGKRCMDWVNKVYTKQHVSLRTAIWEKGFKAGHAGNEHGLSQAGVAWLDKAIDAYYRDRITKTLNKVETHPHETVLKLWNELLTDMYGDEQKEKDEFYKAVLDDENTSQVAKSWLKKIRK